MLLIVLHRPGDLSINGWSIGAWCLRVVIVVIGTYGDVEPLVALGRGLQQAGHTVTIATTTDYELLVTDWSLDFLPLEANVQRLLQSDEGLTALEVGPPPILRHHLTTQRLAGAIETALRAPEISARAARPGRLVRAEGGVARAVEIIQQHLDDA